MTMTTLDAYATTCSVDPGTEAQDASGVHIRKRVFTDRVEAKDARLDGTNKVTLDLDINPDGSGVLAGTFELTLTSGGGGWQGEVRGRFEGGMVVAEGLARGTGQLAGAVLHIDYRQIKGLPAQPPVANPLAFFQITGVLLPA
jgi:hypothetical protein